MQKLLLVLFCLLVVVGCTVKTDSATVGMVPSPSDTTTQISNEWTTYSNSAFKFTISQPPGWEVKDPAESIKPYAGLIVFRPVTADPQIISKDEFGLIKISVSDSKLSVDEYMQTNICDAYKSCTSPKDAVSVEFSSGVKGKRLQEKTGVSPLDIVVVRREGHGPLFEAYIFALALDTGDSLKAYSALGLEERKTIFGTMLKSLRFTE